MDLAALVDTSMCGNYGSFPHAATHAWLCLYQFNLGKPNRFAILFGPHQDAAPPLPPARFGRVAMSVAAQIGVGVCWLAGSRLTGIPGPFLPAWRSQDTVVEGLGCFFALDRVD